MAAGTLRPSTAMRAQAEQGLRPELPRGEPQRHLVIVAGLRGPAHRAAEQQAREKQGVAEPHDRQQQQDEDASARARSG